MLRTPLPSMRAVPPVPHLLEGHSSGPEEGERGSNADGLWLWSLTWTQCAGSLNPGKPNEGRCLCAWLPLRAGEDRHLSHMGPFLLGTRALSAKGCLCPERGSLVLT